MRKIHSMLLLGWVASGILAAVPVGRSDGVVRPLLQVKFEQDQDVDCLGAL